MKVTDPIFSQSLEIPKLLIIECQNVTNKLSQLYRNEKQNKFEIVGEEDVSFKMIRSNATIVAQELDELNKHLKKFMCLNDNIDHKSSEDKDVIAVKRMLVQFYESILPIRSQFELPFNRINEFTDIRDYKRSKNKQKQNFINNFKSLSICLILFAFTLIFIQNTSKMCLNFIFKKINPRFKS